MTASTLRLSRPIDPAALATLRAQLAQDERLAWAASPELTELDGDHGDGETRKTRGTFKIEAVAILGGGYVTIGACVLAARSGQWLWLTVPIAVLLLGLLGVFIASRIKARARRAIEGTVYGLTTRRAMIVRTFPALAVETLPIEAIDDIDLMAPGTDSSSTESLDVADLALRAASGADGLVFRDVFEPVRARNQLLGVVRDPQATEQQIAASEAYAKQMRQLVMRNARG